MLEYILRISSIVYSLFPSSGNHLAICTNNVFSNASGSRGLSGVPWWFCIAGDPYKAPPYKAPYDFDFNAVQLQEHSNQPLEFLRRFPRLFLLRFTTLFWLDAKIWFI